MKIKVAVIGGGAAGLMSAIIAAKNGADVTVYEKSNRVGKKILATGNGRCNYTNMYMSKEFYHGNNMSICENILEFFDREKTIEFFENIGIYPYIGESGKVFPNSLQAASVLDVLRYEADRLNVNEITDCEVVNLRKHKDKFSIICSENIYTSDRVILCCGGKASPQLGTDGSGYVLAEGLGHKLTDIFPALVQLKLKCDFLKKVTGIKFEGMVHAVSNNGIIRTESGEILFTDYGISGPPILQISRVLLYEQQKGHKVYISVDMFPDLTQNDLYDLLSVRFKNMNYKTVEDALVGLINRKLIAVVLNEAKFEYKDVNCGKLNKKCIYSLIKILKEWKFEVTGHNTWQQAQVTAGGIDTTDVNCKTLESKKTKGLYIAGEMLDVDGDCGGYNLQWAWSSGYTAGYNASMQ